MEEDIEVAYVNLAMGEVYHESITDHKEAKERVKGLQVRLNNDLLCDLSD